MNNRKTINIDGNIYEECSHEEWALSNKRAHLEDTDGLYQHYRLKPREPRVWEGTVKDMSESVAGQGFWAWGIGTKVRITEVVE